MKLKRALCAVLALALLPGLGAIKKGPKVRAAGAHDIQLEISSYNESKEAYLDQKVNKGPVTIVGGKVELNTYSAEAGDPIIVTVTPDTGYEIDHVNWGNGLADPVDITDTCTFTMWDAPAFVNVTFTPTAKMYYSYVTYATIGPAYPTMSNTIFMTAEEAAAFTLPPCTLEVYDLSYAFDYWFRWNDDTRYYPGDPYPVGSDVVVFYAAFKKVDTSEYTVHFSCGEGSDTMADVVLDETSAASYTLPDSTFTPPANWTFIMWQDTNTGKMYRPGETCSIPKEGTTFLARYMYDEYFNSSFYGAIFEPGEGTGTTKKVELDNEIDAFRYTLPECDFTAPEGKVFAYWEMGGYSYHPGDNYVLPCDGYALLTAVWKDPVPPCYVVAAGALNVRSGPSIYNDRIGGLTAGKAFQSIDESLEQGEVWVSFDYQGQTAWVMRKYLLLTYSVDTAVKPTTCTVATGALNVRSSPEIPDSSDPNNRIGSMTEGKEFVVTGVVSGKDAEWLCFEYEKDDGTVQLAFVMAKFVDGTLSIIKKSAHSLKINFTIPTGELNDSKAAVASPDEVNLSAENLENRNDGLLKALIYPADAYSFEDLKKEDITLPDGIGMEVMDMLLQEDGGILVTFCPENAVSVAFHGATSSDVFTKYISSGNLIEKPEDPVKEGETFDGWYEDEACTVKFDFTKPVTGDISLFSNFLKNEPTSNQAQENTETETEKEPEVIAPAEQEIIYTATSDADAWTRGSMKSITITVKRNIDDADLCFASFRTVLMDGTPLVQDKDYSVKKGSTIVTIYSATLENLSDGTHTITVEFADGKSEFTLKVEQPAATANTADEATATATPTPTKATTNAKPKTGDVAPTSRMTALIALCAVGLVAVALIDRRKEEHNEE